MTPWRITIHCSDTPDGQDVRMEVLEQAHRAKGWDGIGYHFVIQPDGQIFVARPLDKEGAGVKDANQGNVHICLIGDKKFTEAQWESLRATLDRLVDAYQIKPWELHTHNQFPSAIAQGKTCPNFSVNRLLAWFYLDDTAAILDNLLQREESQ